ncbi:sensor histidine kinase [Aureitalea marina]|uniref:sensor histidine kinase n=1 Tax=Aureitalea marina TaxID=930804 RepID=UPI0011B07DDC|nr:histidine kinase [Aureitalea marina]
MHKQYTYYDGLPSDNVLEIGQDSLGLIYIKSDKGTSLFNGGEFSDLTEEPALNFISKTDSLAVSLYNVLADRTVNVTFMDLQGSWWVGTEGSGLWYFPTGNSGKQNVFIQYIGLNNDREEFPGSQLTIPHQYETLTIGYASPDYTALGRQQFRYKIEGVHQDWVLTRDNKVQFTALPHGETYTFSVAVQDAGGNWSEPATLAMKFEQAFYQSRMFFGLIGVLVIALIWASTRWFFKRQANWAKMNTQLMELEGQALQSQMNPHFVFNSLNSIQSFVSSGDELKAEVYLAKFSDLLRKTLESSKKTRIPLSDEINMLERYLELESMRFGDRLNYSLEVDEKLETDLIQVPAMLIQPFVENAIVHGIGPKPSGGEVKVSFDKVDDKTLLCRVKDNGVGRNKTQNTLHQSMGTDIVRRRLELMGPNENGQVEYIDLVDEKEQSKGTEVIIRIPL